MKSNSLVNWMGAGVLALSLAILPSISSVSAQTNAQTDPAFSGNTNTVDNTDDSFDWGWLGLLGLVGLAGLKKRDRDTTTYRDRPASTTTPASNNPRY